MDSGSPSIMTAILSGVPLTRRAPLLDDAARLAENRSQHRRIFGRRRPRRGRGSNRAQRLIASGIGVAQASGSAPAPLAPTPPATPVRLPPSPTPGSFTLAAGPREGPAQDAFQEAGQTSVGFNFNVTGSGTTAASAAFPATTLALAPVTPPPAWERRVRRRSTTTAGYSPGSWTSTFQRLSNGVLPSGFGGEPAPSGEGGYSPN